MSAWPDEKGQPGEDANRADAHPRILEFRQR